MASSRPLALVTNDDGIDSPFLPVLVAALSAHFRVRIAVPLREQSWIGRALSRHREIAVAETKIGDVSGWTLDGTPTDCINIAMGHLLAEDRPAVVVSGLNIGYNVTLPMLLSSGTLAGAIEGLHWRIPSLAASLALSRNHFVSLGNDRSRMPAEIESSVGAACAHAADVARQIAPVPLEALEVHNLNYPHKMRPDTPVRMTIPAEVHRRSLFQPGTNGNFQFCYDAGELAPGDQPSDRATLEAGMASWTRLNFSRLARSIEIPV